MTRVAVREKELLGDGLSRSAQDVAVVFEVRAFSSDEWMLFRDVRLASLELDTGAFREESRAELSYTDLDWQEWLQEADTCIRGVFVQGTQECIGVGMAFIEHARPKDLWLGGLWLHPDWRGRDAVRPMFNALHSWLEDKRSLKVEFMVAAHREGNIASMAVMRMLGLKYDYTEQNARWMDGKRAKKRYYRAPIESFLAKKPKLV